MMQFNDIKLETLVDEYLYPDRLYYHSKRYFRLYPDDDIPNITGPKSQCKLGYSEV